MITINNPHEYHLKTYQDFIDVNKAIDDYLGTSTYMYRGTLKSICQNFFPDRNHPEAIDYFIRRLFKDNKIIISNQPGLKAGDLEKINTFDVLLRSINEHGIKNPLSLNYFKTKKWGTHPGNSRLFFEDYYTSDVLGMVTDYSSTIKEDYPHLDFLELADCEFDISELHILFKSTIDGSPLSIKEPAGVDYIEYKELTEGPSLELGDPTKYNPPRIYQIKKDKYITVDDNIILEKNNNIWKFYK